MKTIEKAAEELLAELDKLCLHGANVYLGEDKKIITGYKLFKVL